MLASLLQNVSGFAICSEERQYVAEPKQQRRVPKLTVAECAHDLLSLHCEGNECDNNCFDKLRLMPLAAPAMSSSRVELVEAGHRGSSKLLFNKLKLMRHYINNKCKLIYNIRGCHVCADTWFTYHGLSSFDSRVKRVLAEVRRGANEWTVQTGKKSGRPDHAGLHAIVWMTNYVLDYGEQMPTKCTFLLDPVTTKELHSAYEGHARLHQQVSVNRCS